MTAARKVIIYRRDLLNWSETFIREQVLAMQNWRGVLVGERRIPSGLPLDGMDVCLLSDTRMKRVTRMASRVFHHFGRPYPSHYRTLRAIGANKATGGRPDPSSARFRR